MKELQQKKDLILAEKMAKKQASEEKKLQKLAFRPSKLKEQEQKNKVNIVQKELKALEVQRKKFVVRAKKPFVNPLIS